MNDNYCFVGVCRQWNRMCLANDTCSTCPISKYAINKNSNFIVDTAHCKLFVCEFPNECRELIIEWNKSNPPKTCMMDFFEKFPDAPRRNNDIPMPCPDDIYAGVAELCCENDSDDTPDCTCTNCWNQVMPEEE